MVIRKFPLGAKCLKSDPSPRFAMGLRVAHTRVGGGDELDAGATSPLVGCAVAWIVAIGNDSRVVEHAQDYLGGHRKTDVTAEELWVSSQVGDSHRIVYDELDFVADASGVTPNDERWEAFLNAAARQINEMAAAENAKNQVRAPDRLLNDVVGMFVPPLAVLVLGWSLLWALRGFRGQKPSA